jgi:hypothetical protein
MMDVIKLKIKDMKENIAKCRYRKCGKLLSMNVHGNREYCLETGDEKLSCYYLEKLCRQQEHVRKKEQVNQIIGKLNVLLNGRKIKRIRFEQFLSHFGDSINLLQQFHVRSAGYFSVGSYQLYKVQLGEEFYVAIDKQNLPEGKKRESRSCHYQNAERL